jgi:Flp pilus assembly protein TadD
VTAWLLIVAQAVPLLADREIARSQDAVERGDLDEGADAAETAQDIQPWASTPYLQLALVSERQPDLASARAWIGEAIERDGRDWQLWLVSARIETKLGDVAAAERSLRRAIALNPRSPLFAGLTAAGR